MPDGGGFTAEPDAVLSASNGLVTAADGLENALKTLQAALAAQGEGAVEDFGNLVRGLPGVQPNVAKSMKALSGADEDVTSQLSRGQ